MDASIFLITHTDFECPVSDPMYKICTVRDLNNEYPLGILKAEGVDTIESDPFYAELYHYKWIAENVKLPKYIGFCHYRKFFLFQAAPKFDDIFKKYDVIVPKPMQLRCSVRQQYANCHNVEDLDLAAEIVKELYPYYKQEVTACLYSQTFYPCNMFVMKSKDFKAYVKWIFSVLDEFCKRRGDIRTYIRNNFSKYDKNFPEIKNMARYQYRIGGYLAERLTNIYFAKNFKNKYRIPVVMTGERKEVYQPDSIDVGIVHYNTPELMDACIKSIKKNNKVHTHVHVWDNSDKKPFHSDDPDVTIYDNTNQQLVSWDKMLERHPASKNSSGKQNKYASLKHCMSVEALMGFIGKPFVLLDSDTLIKRDLSDLFDLSNAVCAAYEPSKDKWWSSRFIPFCMFLNTPMLIQNGIHFFDEERCCGLYERMSMQDGFDTGASLFWDVNNKALKFKFINWTEYIEHYFNASWKEKGKYTVKQWLSDYKKLYSE